MITEIIGDRISRSKQVTWQRRIKSFRDGLHTFSRNKEAILGLSIIILMVLMGIFAPIIAPYEPTELTGAERLSAPSADHIMGTTHLTQDVFSQWVYGVRVSLMVGLLSGLSVLTVGSMVGIIAGYYKGMTDMVLMRIVDVLYAIPATPLILVIALFFGSTVWNVIIAMVLILWRTLARVVRSQTLSLSDRPFVKAARATGASDIYIMRAHIAPNLVPLMLIEATFVMASAITLEAGISFLGFGATEMISWGVMLQLTFSSGAISSAWWWVLPPGLGIMILVLSIFFVGRGIEDVTNPQLERN
jgi:peptide/nickel transport system permease protein